ncbi:MAG: ergothioneine biosynthesis protein EgtB [Gammaproteobacteria bacterium]|nr:ergothioneine biosynthesis protein EgtB [Gammaproteobacteria bacterium]
MKSTSREVLIHQFKRVRGYTEALCLPLAIDDYQIQSIAQTSPPKWHIAHVSWFFETFVLPHFRPGYQPYCSRFDFLFNSYYYTHGEMYPRPERGLLSRPTVEEVFRYRAHVDTGMVQLMESVDIEQWETLAFRVTLGLSHEQQHQELLLMDVKHNFSVNPMYPVYRDDLHVPEGTTRPVRWLERAGGIQEVGHGSTGFAFDNESPRHEVLVRDHCLADRYITNGEYLMFIEDGGYENPALWLSDGWALIQREKWCHPLYWQHDERDWLQFTLGGLRKLNPHEPVCHISYYEADAYARWAGRRLPMENELETMLAECPITGNFSGSEMFHPAPAGDPGQWFGDLWAWTASPYMAYPGFEPLSGSMGEYNGKFMSNQMVLKGGSCVTPDGHTRASYRNFFYPEERWAFTGLRLAEDG